jgi:hypothetical protein
MVRHLIAPVSALGHSSIQPVSDERQLVEEGLRGDTILWKCRPSKP